MYNFDNFLLKAINQCLPTFSVGHPIEASEFKNNGLVNNFSFKIKESKWTQWQKNLKIDYTAY